MENDSNLQDKLQNIYNHPEQTAQPASDGSDVKISTSIEAIIQHKQRIDVAATSLDTLWRAILAQIDAISSSWVGPDSEAYVEKITKMKPKIEAAIQALKKISFTYKAAADEYDKTQAEIKKRLENITVNAR